MQGELYVWTFETDDGSAELLGVFECAREDAVMYRVGGIGHWAPADCVIVNDGRYPTNGKGC